MTIDQQGFIHPIPEQNFQNKETHFANSQIYYRLDTDPNIIKSKVSTVKKIRSKNNCWICEGWREHHFSLKKDLRKFISEEDKEVNLHLNFEDYKACELNKDTSKMDFEIYRMCPPGDILFYYTINNDVASNHGKNIFIPNEDLYYSYKENTNSKDIDTELNRW